MKCPHAEEGFCPSKRDMNEHTNEQWCEYYCETCGCEKKDVFETPKKIDREIPPPAPRRKRSSANQQY